MRFNPDRNHSGSHEAREKARSLRRDMTPPEKKLWNMLKNGKLKGVKFRRQHPVGPYTADFFCAAARLVIELDGGLHDKNHDARRDLYMHNLGIRVLRFPVSSFESYPEGVLETILRALREAGVLHDQAPEDGTGWA